MVHDVLHRIHDFGHARLVVSAQKGGAVCGDDGFAFMVKQFREFRRLQVQTGNAFEGDVGAVVIVDNLGFHVLARRVRSRIHMGDESYGRDFLSAVGRNLSHHIAVFIERGLDAEIIQLFAKEPQKIELLCRRGLGRALLVALGVHFDVPQKPVQNLFHYRCLIDYYWEGWRSGASGP